MSKLGLTRSVRCTKKHRSTEIAAMTGYLEHQAASAPKESLQHYAEAQRRARRAAGELRVGRLTRGRVKSSRTA
jgi:hypothetical protein